MAVETINKTIAGEEVEKDVATDVVVVTKDNMNDPDIEKVLYPLGKDAE